MLGVKKYMGNKPNFIIFIKVSEYCNINCSFCYQGAPEGSMMVTDEHFDTCYENLDFLLEKFKKLKATRELKNAELSICFFGGEPTVNPAAIIRISKHLEDNYKELRDYMYLSLTTNGTNYVPEAFEAMAKATNKSICVMVSSDYKKCISDKNRKFKDTDESVYDVTQRNIKKYVKLLNDLNGWDAQHVLVSSVLGDVTDLQEMCEAERNLGVITRDAKEQYKSVIRPMMTHTESKETVKEMEPYLEKVKQMYKDGFFKTIEDLADDKNKLIELLVADTFGWCMSIMSECNSISTIRFDGTLAFCNKNDTTTYDGVEINVQENREKVIMNPEYDTRVHLECASRKFKEGIPVKGDASSQALDKLCSIYTFRYSLRSLVIDTGLSDEHLEKINDWIYYYGEDEYPILINEEVRHLIDDANLKFVKFVDFIDEYGFFVNNDGDILGSVLFPDKLSSLNDEHFMWLDTEMLIKSSMFLEEVKNMEQAEQIS